MDRIAFAILPPARPILGAITLLDLALVGYLGLMAVGCWWWFDNWRWALVTALVGAMAFVCDRYVFK